MMAPKRLSSRRGATYLIALLAGSIVTVTGLAALSISTTRARSAVLADYAASARTLARSGLDHALCAVAAHLGGGGTRSNIFGSASPSVTMDGGTFEWTFARMDGSALGNTDEPIVIRAKAQSGPARYGLHATLVPSGVPFDVLDTGLYVGGELTLSAAASLVSDKTVGAVGTVSALAATVSAPIESATSISGTVYLGATTSPAVARRMPDERLIDHYLSLGQRISMASLPAASSGRALENILLSPSSNPFGATNPYGIYIIETGDTRLTVRNIRIVGTLVLIAGEQDRTIIGAGVLMQPAFDWMPSFLVRGGVTFMGTNNGPSESALGINLNPPHTPFRLASDSDTNDDYPASIEGISYVSGNATFALPRQNIRGSMIIGGDASVLAVAVVNINYDPSVATLPPVGFFEDTGGLALDPSSIAWRTPY